MFKKLLTFIFTIFIFVGLFSKTAHAIEDPLSVPNNFYGIHIINEGNLEKAAELVNSSGGDWGYITLVIRKDERDPRRWQEVFNKIRRLRLIPIVRIATRVNEEGWEKPLPGEIDGWISFLNSLNWVTKNRYVVVGNEPNHAKEWQGELDPEGYATYLKEFSIRLKAENNDFFVLPAGFDASAPDGPETMDEAEYLKRMLIEEPDLFNYLDGWTSHSYPNPGFSGSPEASGRGTIRTFEWELFYLSSLGVKNELPVFVTETGWVHNKDGAVLGLSDPAEISLNYRKAFEEVWKDKNIVAVTPFVLSYEETPFDIFSWTRQGGEQYPFYDDIKSIPKVSGDPERITSGTITNFTFQQFIGNSGTYSGFMIVENTGQTIWERENLSVVESGAGFIEKRALFTSLEPGQKGTILFKGNVDEERGEFGVKISLLYKGDVIGTSDERTVTIVKTPTVKEIIIGIRDGFFAKVLPLFRRQT